MRIIKYVTNLQISSKIKKETAILGLLDYWRR